MAEITMRLRRVDVTQSTMTILDVVEEVTSARALRNLIDPKHEGPNEDHWVDLWPRVKRADIVGLLPPDPNKRRTAFFTNVGLMLTLNDPNNRGPEISAWLVLESYT